MKINKNSWHYKLLDKLDLDIPNNLCGYFWKVTLLAPAICLFIFIITLLISMILIFFQLC